MYLDDHNKSSVRARSRDESVWLLFKEAVLTNSVDSNGFHHEGDRAGGRKNKAPPRRVYPLNPVRFCTGAR